MEDSQDAGEGVGDPRAAVLTGKALARRPGGEEREGTKGETG